MQRRFDTAMIVDGQGTARIEGTVAVPPGRHRAIVLVDDPTLRAAETWEAFIDRAFGSVAWSDLARHPQGVCEQQDEIARSICSTRIPVSRSSLVTHNTREFGRVPGIAIEDWLI